MQPLLALMARSAAKKAAPTILASIIGGYTIGQMAAEVEEKASSLPNELLKLTPKVCVMLTHDVLN